jgi:hypothetical protein
MMLQEALSRRAFLLKKLRMYEAERKVWKLPEKRKMYDALIRNLASAIKYLDSEIVKAGGERTYQ